MSSQKEHELLHAGVPAPDLSSVDHQGNPVSLRALRGKNVVVFFYPKDDTPGCTKEACAFRDAWERYSQAGVQILGVSADDAASHTEFAKKYGLPFVLVPDTDLAWANAFGVKTTMGMTQRVSFLIGPDGTIAKVYPKVDPAIHSDEVLKDVAALGD